MQDKIKEAIALLMDCKNMLKECESTTIGRTNINVKIVQIEQYLSSLQSSVVKDDEDEVTHEQYFGENIRRIKNTLFGQTVSTNEHSTSISVPANEKVTEELSSVVNISDEEIEAMAEKARREVSNEAYISKDEEDAFDLGFYYGFKERDKLQSSVKGEDKEVSKIIDDLYKEYVIHEELPVDFQIGMQWFLAELKSKLLVGHVSYDGKLDTLEAMNEMAEVARKKKSKPLKEERVSGIIHYEISEEEIQKAISDYKANIKLEKSHHTDEQIRDFCIKSLVKHKVGFQSYTNPETIKEDKTK